MAKKKEMNRTSGVAGRKLGRSEGIATKLKYGAPLTGSASGVKSISLKDVGETLTQGIFSVNRKGLKADPAGLAMALPLGKVAAAAKALKAAGKVGNKLKFAAAEALEARLGAKIRGKEIGRTFSYFDEPVNVAKERRVQSESIYPRAKFDMNPLAKAEYKAGAKEIARSKMAQPSTMNIVDTRRMNPAQAKAALEGGVSQTAKIARRIPGKEKPVRGATARLLKGRGK
jgi:hypothetical protein